MDQNQQANSNLQHNDDQLAGTNPSILQQTSQYAQNLHDPTYQQLNNDFNAQYQQQCLEQYNPQLGNAGFPLMPFPIASFPYAIQSPIPNQYPYYQGGLIQGSTGANNQSLQHQQAMMQQRQEGGGGNPGQNIQNSSIPYEISHMDNINYHNMQPYQAPVMNQQQMLNQISPHSQVKLQKSSSNTINQSPSSQQQQQQNNYSSPQVQRTMQRTGLESSENNQDDERVITKSPFTHQSSTSTPKFPSFGAPSQIKSNEINQMSQNNRNIMSSVNGSHPPSSGNQSSSMPSQFNKNKEMGVQNGQMQSLVKNFFDAIKKGDIETVVQDRNKLGIDVSTLLDENAYKQNVMFSAAIIKDENASLAMIRVFAEMGVRVNFTDTLNQTPLFYATREGHNQVIDYLVSHGCQVNHIDTYGQNAFFYCVREGHLQTCQKHASLGANIDIVDNNGQTPLYYAIKHSRYEICEYLLQNGANINIKDKREITPIQFAKSKNKQALIELLVKHGATPINNPNNKKSKVPLPIKQKTNERKIPKPFLLTVLKDGYYQPMSQEEFEKFIQDYPEYAKYFTETLVENEQILNSLPVPDVPENAPIYECWDKAAKRLLNTLWKHNNSWIFHEPVDPQKLGIPDYFEIIKHPMDFGTIKNNLQSNKYQKIQEFLDDVHLVFDNCIHYNGENSQVSHMCKHVREEYQKLYESLYIEFYLE